MQATWLRRSTRLGAALVGLAALVLATLPAQAAPFNGQRNLFSDDGFRTVWTRTDAQSVRGGRTWYWGPQPWFDYAEFYRQGVNGLRTVQYFDKARMEINNPNDRNFQGGVTNGLLVVELVSGHLKKGNDPYDYDARQPADVPVAGNPKADNPNGATYGSFTGLATFDSNGYKDANKLSQRVGATLDKGGNLSFRQDLADAHAETTIVQFNSLTGHNIPKIFWDFLNMQGPVVEGGRTSKRTIVDWTFAMGLPITDAYWTRAKIGANERDVLVQLYERRVLTYVPDNPAGYKVEMGNVGQHYFQWRYPNLGQPWAAPDPSMPLLYAANGINSDHLEVWQYLTTGSAQITGNPLHPSYVAGESVAFSYRRSYDPTQNCLIVDSRRGDGQHRQIYQQPILPVGFSDSFQNTCLPERLTYSDGTQPPPGMAGQGPQTANDYNPSISPDGTKLVFVSDRDGAPQLYLMTANGNSYPQRLNMDGCLTQVPTWSPDGRTLYWEQQCNGGKYAIMRGDMQYTDDSASWASAMLTNIRALTDQNADNRFPRVSPDGKRIAFTSYRDGNAEIYLMNADGGAVTRLTNSAGDDEAASWSSNGSQLAFASNRDGDYEVYTINTDGSGLSQLTNNDTVDRWVLWAQ